MLLPFAAQAGSASGCAVECCYMADPQCVVVPMMTVFPRYTMLTSATLRIKCLIEGETIVFPVTAGRDDEVSDLKEFIQSKRALDSLKDVDPYTLELWKVSAIDEPLYVK